MVRNFLDLETSKGTILIFILRDVNFSCSHLNNHPAPPKGSLHDVILLWERLHPTPNQQSVLNLLKKIADSGYKSLETFKIECRTVPGVHHLVRDIFDNENIHLRDTRTGRNAGSKCDFFAAWEALKDNPGADINDRLLTPYSAWGVKAKENGLLACGLRPPQFLLDPGVFISPVGNGEELPLASKDELPCFHSIITPAGTITDVHCDCDIAASLLVQLYGTKVLFSWPGTKANRDYFQHSVGIDHHLRLPEAVSKMTEGFKFTILKPGDAVVLEPGMIHAVVSPENSAIGCWEYVDEKWFDNDDIKEGAEWIVNSIKSRGPQLPTDESKEEIYNPLRYGLSMWKCLLQNLQERQRRKYVEGIRDFVEWLEKELPEEIIETGRSLSADRVEGSTPATAKRRMQDNAGKPTKRRK